MHHGHTLGNLCGPLPQRERHFGPLDAGGWAEVARVLREGGWAYVLRGRADRLPGATVLMVCEREADLLPELPEGLMLAALGGGAEEVVVLGAPRAHAC